MVEVVDRRGLTRPEMHTWAVDRRKSGSNRERLNAGSMDAHPDPQGWTIPRSCIPRGPKNKTKQKLLPKEEL